MKYYLIPKYRKAIQSGTYQQETLTNLLTKQGDWDLPTLVDKYPTVSPAHFKQFFATQGYTVLDPVTPVSRQLTTSGTKKPAYALRTELEIAVSRISDLPTVKEDSHRLRKMKGEI